MPAPNAISNLNYLSGKTQNIFERVSVLTFDAVIGAMQYNVYELVIDSSGVLDIRTSVSFDTVLILTDSAGNVITNDDDGGINGSSHISYSLTVSGTYYLVFFGYSSNSGTSTITISGVTLAPVTPTPVIIPSSNNIKIGYKNLIDDATITATGISVTLPADNLKSLLRGRVFRGLSGTQTINVAFKSASTISMIALWFPTQSQVAVDDFSVTFYNGNNTVKTVTSTAFSAFFNEIIATRAELIITSPVVFVLSRIFIGRYFEPVNNLEFGFSMKQKDLSVSERTEDGSLFIQKKEKFRTLTISLADITNSERQELTYLVNQSGTQNDIFVSVFGGEDSASQLRRDYEMFGIFEDGAEMALTSANRWSQKLTVNEL